jgi:serine/threonine protein kinase
MKGVYTSLNEGVVIAGQFRLKRQIGEGGAGAVWEADHLRLGGLAAIKFLGPEHLDDAEYKQRFVHEARAASKIRSPHVVQVLDHGTTDGGIPYLVMELLEGQDLAAHLDQVGACSLAETARVLDQIGCALTKAHQQGLVHRDIKPHNIFLTPEGDGELFVKLLDFGIAKDTSCEPALRSDSGVVLGSAHYISPEQLEDSQAVGPATDIWSLGVVVYEMLTGDVPFDGRCTAEVLERVKEARFAPLCEGRPELPRALDAWFGKAVHRDPARRFASVDEMTRAFARIVRAHSTAMNAPASESRTHDTPTAARSRLRAALAVSLGVALMAATIFVLRGGARPHMVVPAARAPVLLAAGQLPAALELRTDALPPGVRTSAPVLDDVASALPAPLGARTSTTPRKPRAAQANPLSQAKTPSATPEATAPQSVPALRDHGPKYRGF